MLQATITNKLVTAKKITNPFNEMSSNLYFALVHFVENS